MKNPLKKLKLKRRGITVLAGMHFFGNPSAKLKVVGVTGTNGKTTTATLLYKITTELGYKAGLIGTVENIIVNERRPALITTPSPINLYKLLNEMADRGCEYVFMEVSSHALDQNRVAGINFVGGIFTNLTHDHLDYHKSIDNYFGAKKKFFKMLPKDAFALSNIDDEYGLRMLEHIQAKKYTYGLKNKADFSEKLQTGLIGDFNAYNALAVYAASILLGFDKGKVVEVLKKVTPPRGRFEHFTSKSGVLVIIDYAHTPDALENVLKTAQGIRKDGSKIISVFGCGGDRDPAKRKIMGKIGVLFSDIAIFTSDNPRNEDPEKIIEEMKADLSPDDFKKIKTIPNRREAILESVKLAQSGDIILCAGKGHEEYQDIKGVKNHFNDMEEYKKAYA
ncbi:MAG: UDP-N-acetylmuramoyl-L-alanyl-D-glutamate--2,6-diaminopimelate ligase [Patescibacteria group bacterium]|nr:UDP-N-acetylmuramoyl-L-alanyl-D-glutamate--2,6-diaminopimelate ligase [Patescibacteria group bacterium]